MGMFERFKNYLGISSISPENEIDRRSLPQSLLEKEDNRSDTPTTVPDQYDSFGFNIFSSPLEMHRYFERQMNEMLKSFGIVGAGADDSFFGSFGANSEPFFGDNPFGANDSFQFPSIEDFGNNNRSRNGSLRDQYLKPGYEAIPRGQKQVDQDVDEKFNMNELDTVLKGRPTQTRPRRFFYSQSMTTKTIRNADGTVESHKTVKDQEGNEETIITKRNGNKEYSVTTKKNKDGQQEIIENMVNLDEHEKDVFLKGNSPISPDHNIKIPSHYFPYEKFF